MSPEPNLPPPIPSVPPAVPPPKTKKKTSPWLITAIIGGALLFLIVVVAIPMAIFIPTVHKVRETARRTVDASNLRQIVQASLIYSTEHGGRLPGRSIGRDGAADGTQEPATVQLVAAALARDGGLNDTSVWFSTEDRSTALAPASAIAALVRHDDGTLNTSFMEQKSLGWDYATGLHTSLPSTTPVAWTRGLRRDGSWDPDGVYGSDGGYIAFLGGSVRFYRNLTDSPLVTPDGKTTTDILMALPNGHRVVGSGPATLGGSEGDGP